MLLETPSFELLEVVEGRQVLDRTLMMFEMLLRHFVRHRLLEKSSEIEEVNTCLQLRVERGNFQSLKDTTRWEGYQLQLFSFPTQ